MATRNSAVNIGDGNTIDQLGSKNTVNHVGHNNRTFQNGTANDNKATGSKNKTGQCGNANTSGIKGKENDTYQHGGKNKSTISDANKAQVGMFGSGLRSRVETDGVQDMKGDTPQGWSWDGWFGRVYNRLFGSSSS